jgi:hypothetical protein
MTPLVIIFAPFVRLLFHSLAASFGFSGIALITILPVQVIRLMSTYTALNEKQIALFDTVESGILYMDAILLVFVILIYSLLFIFEQIRAMWTLFKLQTSETNTSKQPDGVAS